MLHDLILFEVLSLLQFQQAIPLEYTFYVAVSALLYLVFLKKLFLLSFDLFTLLQISQLCLHDDFFAKES